MSYQLKEGTLVDVVSLKVKDIEKAIIFLKDVLGLDLLREENGIAFVGIKETKKMFISLLEKPDGQPSDTTHNGLYHVGILLPSRGDLASIYQHLLKIGYPIMGLSDLGHSEAIYLKDPEFNGIKLYWDKPKAEWNYHTEGQMDSVLGHLDSQTLLAEATEVFTKMPKGTRVGHVHLNVVDIEASQRFYENVLGFKLTSAAFPRLRYLAVGDYHHQLGLNTLNDVPVNDHNDDNLGLDYVSLKVSSLAELDALQAHLQALDYDYFYNKGKQIVQFDDPNGIHIWVHAKEFKK